MPAASIAKTRNAWRPSRTAVGPRRAAGRGTAAGRACSGSSSRARWRRSGRRPSRSRRGVIEELAGCLAILVRGGSVPCPRRAGGGGAITASAAGSGGVSGGSEAVRVALLDGLAADRGRRPGRSRDGRSGPCQAGAAVDKRVGVGTGGRSWRGSCRRRRGRGRYPAPGRPSSWLGPASPIMTSPRSVPSRSSIAAEGAVSAAAIGQPAAAGRRPGRRAEARHRRPRRRSCAQ